MSHLQPAFIAKAKSSAKQAKAPHRMSNSMVRREACVYPIPDWSGKIHHEHVFCLLNHRVFTLRK